MLPGIGPLSRHQRRPGERGIWQRRYWEHTICDPEDYRRHLDYIHYNPVRHGLVSHPRDWPYSSLERYIRMQWYSSDQGITGCCRCRRRGVGMALVTEKAKDDPRGSLPGPGELPRIAADYASLRPPYPVAPVVQ
ncbi:MAG: hypothetical protein U5L11_00640 [Arhodomonas sp.]|nr:hypothetical protein [Arhodomonas sp.]